MFRELGAEVREFGGALGIQAQLKMRYANALRRPLLAIGLALSTATAFRDNVNPRGA
jgi:hypothetical protein